MADLRCARCDQLMPRPMPLGHGLRGVAVCPTCQALVVSEQGEMLKPDDRANPDDYGGLGWA